MSAPVPVDFGTQTADGSEQQLATIGVPGIYQFFVNLVNLAAGDTVIVRVYYMYLTGGTPVVVWKNSYTGVQDPAGVYTDVFPQELLDSGSVLLTIEQTAAGTALEDFDWKVLSF